MRYSDLHVGADQHHRSHTSHHLAANDADDVVRRRIDHVLWQSDIERSGAWGSAAQQADQGTRRATGLPRCGFPDPFPNAAGAVQRDLRGMNLSIPTRRGLLAATLSAACLPRVARTQPTNPGAVVIGAGAAGIAAARRLIAQGRSVIVSEAADRIGARANTESQTFGVPYDRGAWWIQGTRGLPYVPLARERGYALVPREGAGEAFYVGDRPANDAEWQAYGTALDRIEAAIYAWPDVSAASRLPADLPMSATVQSWIGPMDYGVDFADLSLGDVNSYGNYAYNYLIREGFGTLVAELGEGLPVLTGVAVKDIDWGGPAVRVETTRGTFAAEACIVTVSSGVLASGAIRFSPDLPPARAQAIDDVPMGLLVKIALQFDGERFGLSENNFITYAVPNEVPARACYFLTWPTGSELCIGFAGGAFGWDLSRAGEAEAVDFAPGEFAGMVGSRARRHFVRGHMPDWALNPLTLGAYSAARPGKHASCAVLAEPLGGRLFRRRSRRRPLPDACHGGASQRGTGGGRSHRASRRTRRLRGLRGPIGETRPVAGRFQVTRRDPTSGKATRKPPSGTPSGPVKVAPVTAFKAT